MWVAYLKNGDKTQAMRPAVAWEVPPQFILAHGRLWQVGTVLAYRKEATYTPVEDRLVHFEDVYWV